MLTKSSSLQKLVTTITMLVAATIGLTAVKSFTRTPQYVAMRHMIPVGQSLEEAEILYNISRSATHDCLESTDSRAAMLTSVPETATSETLIGYLEGYCSELHKLAVAVELQEKQRDKLNNEGESRLTAWTADVAKIQNLEKRTVEENKITKARMDFQKLVREANDELAVIHASIRDGRDIELYIASLKHACRMGSTSEAVRTLKNDLTLKANSFKTRTNDILTAWK